MTKNLASLAAGMIALLVASSHALAVGTASRTFVSGVGCRHRPLPCHHTMPDIYLCAHTDCTKR